MTTRPLTPLQRATTYVLFVVIGTLLAFWMGMKVEEQSACGAADFDGECDLAGLAGVVWAAVFLVVAMGLIVGAELLLRFRQRRLEA